MQQKIIIRHKLVPFILSVALIIGSSDSVQVSVYTFPNSGPKYKAGSLVNVACLAENGVKPYTYSWSIGCSFTNIKTNYVHNSSYLSSFITISKNCQNSYTCKVTDASGDSASDTLVIETITDIGIVITTNNYNLAISNISILAANESGRFLDIFCGSGLKQPNLGKWIHPNGTELTVINQKYLIGKGGGINSLPYITLSLNDGYSLSSSYDYGLYTCKMMDIERVEREKHIWIMKEQDLNDPTPEHFESYSGTESVTMRCRYSNTPGRISWYNVGQQSTISNNESLNIINQHLLQTNPVVYEGVLKTKLIVNSLVRCAITSIIISSSSLVEPSHRSIHKRHYFFLQFIGQPQNIQCSFPNTIPFYIKITLDGQVLASNLGGPSVSYRIPEVNDSLHNHEYDCIATSTNTGTVLRVSSFTIAALIPSHALTMYVQQPQVTEAGQTLTLDLSAIKTSGFSHDQSIACTNETGTPLTHIHGFFYPSNPTHTGLTLAYSVPINPVKLSHAGLYLCTATLKTAHKLDNITDYANFTITAKIPIPTVILNNETSTGKVGSIAEFNCTVSLLDIRDLLDIPIAPIITWTVNGKGINLQLTRYYVSDITSAEGDIYYSKLNIVPLMKEDESTVTCTAQLTPSIPNQYIIDSQEGQASLSLSVEGSELLEAKLIQFQFVGQQQCSHQWMNKANVDNITSIILEALKGRCNCQYTMHYVVDQQITCLDGIMAAVTYRARIYESDTTEASTLVEYLQEWVSSNKGLQLTLEPDNTQVVLNADCNVSISSFNDSPCEIKETGTTTIIDLVHDTTTIAVTASTAFIATTAATTTTTTTKTTAATSTTATTAATTTTATTTATATTTRLTTSTVLLAATTTATTAAIATTTATTSAAAIVTTTFTRNVDVNSSNNPLIENDTILIQLIGFVCVIVVIVVVIVFAGVCIMRRRKRVRQHNVRTEEYTSVNPMNSIPLQSLTQYPQLALYETPQQYQTSLCKTHTLPQDPSPPPLTSFKNAQYDYDQWNHQRRNLPDPPHMKQQYNEPIDKYQNTKTVDNMDDATYMYMADHNNHTEQPGMADGNKHLYEYMDNYYQR